MSANTTSKSPSSAAALTGSSTTQPPRRRWKGHSDAVSDVQPSPCGLTASASDDGTVRIWQQQQQQQPRGASTGAATIRCIRYRASATSRSVSCCTWYASHATPVLFTAHGRCIAVWDLHTCREHELPLVCTRPAHVLLVEREEEKKSDEESEDEINQLQISEDGSVLAACDDGGRWSSWRVTSSAPFLSDVSAGTTFTACRASSLSFSWLGCLHPAHDNLCSSIAFLPQPHPQPPLILSAGFDYRLVLSSADGKQRLAQWSVSEWVNEQRQRAEISERGERPAVATERKQPPQRNVQTAAQRLRAKLKQKQPPAASTAVSKPLPAQSPAPTASSSPLTNPPFPHCLAASKATSRVLVGLGDGQLALFSPLTMVADTSAATSPSFPLLIDAHANAVVAVAWLGSSAVSGCEYWVSAGSDKRVAIWRSGGVAERRQDMDQASKAERCVTETVSDVWETFDRLDPVSGPSSGCDGLLCVWSFVHGWKVNSVSCAQTGAAADPCVALYVADVSQRVAVYSIT